MFLLLLEKALNNEYPSRQEVIEDIIFTQFNTRQKNRKDPPGRVGLNQLSWPSAQHPPRARTPQANPSAAPTPGAGARQTAGPGAAGARRGRGEGAARVPAPPMRGARCGRSAGTALPRALGSPAAGSRNKSQRHV